MESKKLYDEFNISDMDWENTSSIGIYKLNKSSLSDYDTENPCIDLVSLNRYNFSNWNSISGIGYLSYFTDRTYLYINFGTTNPLNCDLKLQLAKVQEVTISLSGSGLYLLSVNSRTNNSTYVKSSSGELLSECMKSKAPYARVWALDPALGSVTLYKPGVATYKLFSVGADGDISISNIVVNGQTGTLDENNNAVVNVDKLIAGSDGKVYAKVNNELIEIVTFDNIDSMLYYDFKEADSHTVIPSLNSATLISGEGASGGSYYITMPSREDGKVSDFVFDIINTSSTEGDNLTLEFNGLDNYYNILIKKGEDLSAMTTFGPGVIARLSITESAVQLTGLPTYIAYRVDLINSHNS